MCSFQRTMVLVVCCSWRVVSGRGSPSEPSSLTFDWSGRRSEQPTTGNPQPASIVFGGYKAVVRPDPIPNSAVKRSVADGSACIACARVGSRQIYLFANRDLFSDLTCSPIRKNHLPVNHRLCREIGNTQS